MESEQKEKEWSVRTRYGSVVMYIYGCVWHRCVFVHLRTRRKKYSTNTHARTHTHTSGANLCHHVWLCSSSFGASSLTFHRCCGPAWNKYISQNPVGLFFIEKTEKLGTSRLTGAGRLWMGSSWRLFNTDSAPRPSDSALPFLLCASKSGVECRRSSWDWEVGLREGLAVRSKEENNVLA